MIQDNQRDDEFMDMAEPDLDGLTEDDLDFFNELEREEAYSDDLCAACQEREIDRSENPRSALCYPCRQRYIKLRIPIGIKFFLAAIFVVFVFSAARLPSILTDYKNYLSAEKHGQKMEYSLACELYYPLAEQYPDSVPLIMKTASAAMNAQYFGYAAQMVFVFLPGKTVNDDDYAMAMEFADFLNAYYGTLQAFDDIGSEFSQRLEEGSPEDALRFLRQELQGLLERDGLDKMLVYYNLSNIADSPDEALEYLKLSTEQDGRFTSTFALYGNALRRMRRYTEAEEILRTALGRHASDAPALRGLSILQLLEGQKALALETIRYAYAVNPNELYMPDTLLVALYENGLRDEADVLLEQLISEGFIVDDDLRDYMNGSRSPEQIYLYEPPEETNDEE